MNYGGHGIGEHLLCKGAKAYQCWNTVTVNGPEAAKYIAKAVLQAIEALPGYDLAFETAIRAQAADIDGARQRRLDEIDNRCRALEKAKTNRSMRSRRSASLMRFRRTWRIRRRS